MFRFIGIILDYIKSRPKSIQTNTIKTRRRNNTYNKKKMCKLATKYE